MPGAPVLTRHLLLAAVAAYADAVAAPWKSVSVEDFGALGDNHTDALSYHCLAFEYCVVSRRTVMALAQVAGAEGAKKSC